MVTSLFFHIFCCIPFLFMVETAFCSPFKFSFPDTLNGTTAYGAYSIIRTDTSFSGTVCDGQVFVKGRYDADSVYLKSALLDSSDFQTSLSYLPGDAVWSNAILLISSFCKNLIDIDLALAQKGISFPSGLISLFLYTGTASSDGDCWPPIPPDILSVKYYYGSLNGTLHVWTACMAILFGATTDFSSTHVDNGGIIFSPTLLNPVVPALKSSEIIVEGSVYIAGSVEANSVHLDGSFGRATFNALSLETRTLDVEASDMSVTETVAANKIGSGTTGLINVSGNSIVRAGQITTPIIVSSGSTVSASGLVVADELIITGGIFHAGDLNVPLVTMNGGVASVSNIGLVDSLTMTSAEFHGGLSMSAKKIYGTNSLLGGSLLQVKQGPAVIDFFSSQINAGTLDADFMNLDMCSVSFGNIITKQTIANNSSFQGGLLNARTGRSLFYLNTGSVAASHINAGTYNVRNVTTTTPFMEGDTLLTWGGSIHDPGEDSLRIHFLHRSFIDSTLVYSDMIYASLAQAEVTQGSRFESDRRGDGPRSELIAFPGETVEKGTGASYGGYGGTTGDMNINRFTPADDPVGVPDFSADDIRKGLGGFGRLTGHESAGVGGGRIRIDASSLVWSGYASVNGGNAEQPIPLGYNGGGGGGGGTGGTVHIDVSGMFSGNGRIESNGGGGTYGFGGDLSFLTGSGGSGGRIRINYGTLGNWSGTVKALGGAGGRFDTASVPYYPGRISPWIDVLNNGGPGTIYWKQQGGNGRILIDGDGGLGGVGRVDGNYPQDTLEVHGALAVTSGLQLGGLKLTNGGILRAGNPRVRLRFPPPVAYGVSSLFYPIHMSSNQTIYPLWVWQDSLREKLTINLTNDVFVDATSRLDLTGQGGYGQADFDFVNGAYGNRAGGSYGGYGGWGRWGSEHQMGKPNAVNGDPLRPEEVGEGGYGERNYVNTWHAVTALGGAGGGALRLSAGGTVQVDGTIVSDGGRGQEDTAAPDGQGTGGGSGGSIWITAGSLAGSGIVSASGGDGSYEAYYHAWGGGGGGGRIRLDYGTKSGWSGDVKTFGGRGGQFDSSHVGLIPWTNPRMHGGAGTVYWNGPGLPTLEIRNFAHDSGTASLSGTFPGVGLVIRNALAATTGLGVETLTMEDHAVLAADDNRITLYSFPEFVGAPRRFPFWTPKVENHVAFDAAGDVSIDATSRIEVSGLGGFSREDYDALRGVAENPAGGSHGGVGGTGRIAGYDGIVSPVFGDSASPVLAGLGGFGDEALLPWGLYDQAGASGSGGGALRISVGGTLYLQGSVRSIGLSGTPVDIFPPDNGNAPSGGAGGSIFLAAGQVTGSGLIDASGGDGVFNPAPLSWGGGGGGGRIAVYGLLTGFTGSLRADGGLGGAGSGVDSMFYAGQPGTIVTGTGAPGAVVPFTIVHASIADGDTAVSRTDPFRLILNKPAKLSTLVFTLSPDPGSWGVRGNFGGDSLWLDHAPLSEQTTYTLNIVQLRSMFGDTLGAGSAKRWDFSTGGTITDVKHDELVPLEFSLWQNYPNPFNPTTTIRYGLPSLSRVSLKIFNILGQQVANIINTEQPAGWHEVTWNAKVASGLYFYRIDAVSSSDPNKRFTQLKKMLLLK